MQRKCRVYLIQSYSDGKDRQGEKVIKKNELSRQFF